eukprot:12768-Heterococcus_DN1.PRE.4
MAQLLHSRAGALLSSAAFDYMNITFPAQAVDVHLCSKYTSREECLHASMLIHCLTHRECTGASLLCDECEVVALIQLELVVALAGLGALAG